MSEIAMNAARLIDMLPDEDQNLAYELIRKLVLAWDPDFTKATPDETARMMQAEKGEFLSEAEIDWNNLSRYAD